MSSKDVDSLRDWIQDLCSDSAEAEHVYSSLAPHYNAQFDNWLDGFDSESMSWRDYVGGAPVGYDSSTKTFYRSFYAHGSESLSLDELLAADGKLPNYKEVS